jgi:acyl carrier protein
MTSCSDPASIADALCHFLRSQILAEGVALEADTPLTQLGIDSAATVEMLLFIERQFGVMVPDSALTLANLATAGALARCVCDIASAEGDVSGKGPTA